MTIQPQPVGSAMGPRNGTGPNGAIERQLQQQQIQQQLQDQQIQDQQRQQQNQQQIQQQAAMMMGAGLNINFTA